MVKEKKGNDKMLLLVIYHLLMCRVLYDAFSIFTIDHDGLICKHKLQKVCCTVVLMCYIPYSGFLSRIKLVTKIK